MAAITHASEEVGRLKGRFLVGPLGRTHDDLLTRLPHLQGRATFADHGLAAPIAFAGESEPKRSPFLSQNPDEILAVTGPVQVAAFGQTVTAANMNERLDFHTHQAPRSLVTAGRHWDGAFPTPKGEIFFDSEFAYISKNGRVSAGSTTTTSTCGLTEGRASPPRSPSPTPCRPVR